MYVLGIICHGQHEAAAALLADGKVIAAAEEERFSRIKFDSSFPKQAIQYCLDYAGIKSSQLSAVGFGFDPRRKLAEKAAHILKFLPESMTLVKTRGKLLDRMNRIVEQVREELDYTGPVLRLNHHLCHAASTFYASPFESASVLTLDGVGDWESVWWGIGDGNGLRELGTIDWPNSIGHVYSAFTDYLGFKPFSDEYKVMGLAPYGAPKYLEKVAQVMYPTDTGIGIDYSYFNYQVGKSPRYSPRLVELFGPALREKNNEEVPQHYRDVASSLQAQTELVIFHLVKRLIQETGNRNLCLAGGVAMNSVANGKLISEGYVDRLYVPPCASDAGVALGAAYLAHLEVGGTRERHHLDTGLLGPAYDDKDLEAALNKAGLVYERQEDITQKVAEMLADGKVVGWFQGRMEFGQRALGSRSIVADPRRAEMKDIVNAKIKFREMFRPFAPSVLEERATEFFEIPPGGQADFMTQVYPVLPNAGIPAVTHVDGSGRVQTVKKSVNPRYWQMIAHFDELTGVPVVLNTSFNVKGQPIVNTPKEAIETFLATEMDGLALGDFLVLKPLLNLQVAENLTAG